MMWKCIHIIELIELKNKKKYAGIFLNAEWRNNLQLVKILKLKFLLQKHMIPQQSKFERKNKYKWTPYKKQPRARKQNCYADSALNLNGTGLPIFL